ncbi:Gfo/Idh/MocA family protein [Candidatus Entotheonella palauensis]|uniref:Oxidoreductase n=1 Tax=Candidatus Entotheonella gemina TaxID=1429439 RepID=W4M679_9BACT|nr:Gfo/Idh/MocA family oxidoreductase [Candidatus Entotheonella palauensis]ETX05829.1 MAG: oxidoreductase [Candidatus Entotheonella gemina]
MINVGIIGYGYWGKHILRNFSGHEATCVRALCDTNTQALQQARQVFPGLEMYADCQNLLRSANLDAVAIITPSETHYDLARTCLQHGKHIFIEKPFVATEAQADELINLATQKNLTIMIDHTFLFSSPVRKIKELIDDDVLGTLYYFDSMRVNLGPFRHDANVVWDLAPHDFSIIDYLIEDKPVALSACGKSLFGNGIEDVGYITLYFHSNVIAHINLNWLSPIKVRTTYIGGAKKMLVWDDLNPNECIKIYDKGVVVENRNGHCNHLVSAHSGDMWSPKVDQQEALRLEVDHFVDCLLRDTVPISDGHTGLRVVKLLEAANASLKTGGKLMYL